MSVQDVKEIDVIVKKMGCNHLWCTGCWWCLRCRSCHCKKGDRAWKPGGVSSWRNLSVLAALQQAGELTFIPLPGPDGQPMLMVTSVSGPPSH